MRQVARDLGISLNALQIWVREADEAEDAAAGVLAADEHAELLELRRRVRVLETERDILKKAAAFFAQESERTR
jgi:transposase